MHRQRQPFHRQPAVEAGELRQVAARPDLSPGVGEVVAAHIEKIRPVADEQPNDAAERPKGWKSDDLARIEQTPLPGNESLNDGDQYMKLRRPALRTSTVASLRSSGRQKRKSASGVGFGPSQALSRSV